MARRGKTAARGYGTEHQKLRAKLLPTAYGQPCSRCGMTMHRGQPLDLDHTDDRDGYQGFAHRSCNRRAGVRNGNEQRRGGAPRTFKSSRW